MSSGSFGDDPYTPPAMFSGVSEGVVLDELQLQSPSESTKSIIIPGEKPIYIRPVPLPVVKKARNIGVSKSIVKSTAVSAPSVASKSLIPIQEQSLAPRVIKEESKFLDTSIAFLPASVDLTKMQKRKFQDVIETYYFERDASHMTLRIYASPDIPKTRNSEKRKALARGLSVREWLKSQGVSPENITLKTVGAIKDGGLPDRVDIRILY